LSPESQESPADIYLSCCSGFSWDRVNFHNKLVGLTQIANPMGYSILC